MPSSQFVSEILNKKIKEKDFTLLIVLDNFDRMDHVDDLLWKIYTISSKLPRLGLILISTSKPDLENLIGKRLYDRLNPKLYGFEPYDANRLYELLSSRIKEVYDRKVAEDKALRTLAGYIANKGGNAREMFQLFLDALELSQRDGRKVVTCQIIDEVKRRC